MSFEIGYVRRGILFSVILSMICIILHVISHHYFGKIQLNDNIPKSEIVFQHPYIASITICIGVKKGGTSSLNHYLSDMGSIATFLNMESHYFDNNKYITSNMSDTINKINKHGSKYYIRQLSSLFKRTIKRNNFYKTPSYIIWPHISVIISDKYMKYGTKIVAALRDPNKRYISDYYHTKIWYTEITRFKNIDELVFEHSNKSRIIHEFNNKLDVLYYQYLNEVNNKTDILLEVVRVYEYSIYKIIKYKPRYRHWESYHEYIWFHSCYAPQILTWMYYINGFNTKNEYLSNSFKVFQSEKLFNTTTLIDTLKYLKCYIEYHNYIHNDYHGYLNDCIIKSSKSNTNNIIYYHLNNASQDTTLINSNMFDVCNKWLIHLLEHEFKHILLTPFDWNLWK